MSLQEFRVRHDPIFNPGWRPPRNVKIRHIINETDIPTKDLRAICNFVAPPGKWHATIRFANGENSHGNASLYSCNVWLQRKGHRDWRGPVTWRKGNGYLGGTVYSRIEAAVYLAAHELRHVQKHQLRGKVRQLRVRGMRKGGRAGNETDCDRYAIQQLRQWRRQRLIWP